MPKLSEVQQAPKRKLSEVDNSDFARMVTVPQATSRTELLRRREADRNNPTEDMSAFEKGRAGFAQSFVNAGQGLKQVATERLRDISRGDFFGLMPDDQGPENAVSLWAKKQLAEQQAVIDERRRLEAPLDATVAGKVGNITGNLAQILGPGIAARGTLVGRALLPTTIRGNIAQGAALGYVQPTESGESRNLNAAIGGAVGGLIPAAIKAPGAVRRTLGAAVNPGKAASKEAVRMIQREAADSTTGLVPNLTRVPGAQTPRTLFEETLDPGIARLETHSRGVGTGWADRDSSVNAERMAALRGFAGDEADIAAAEQARSAATRGLRNKAFAEGDEAARLAGEAGFSLEANKANLKSIYQGIAAENGGRGAVQRAVQDVIGDLDNAEPSVRGLYNVRKSINDMIEGKAGMDKAYAKAATAELMQMRDVLDDEIANLAPSFEQYRSTFQDMSGPINRMQTGQELIRRGTSGVDPVTGEYRLMPGQFGRAAKDLDAVAQAGTGFKKAQAANVLQAADTEAVSAINDDLARQASRLVRGAGGNSHTASQLEVGKRLAVRSLARVIPGVGAAVEFLEAQGAKRLEKALERVLANPAEYRALAKLVSKEDRRLLEGALLRIAGPANAATVPALTE